MAVNLRHRGKSRRITDEEWSRGYTVLQSLVDSLGMRGTARALNTSPSHVRVWMKEISRPNERYLLAILAAVSSVNALQQSSR